MNNQLLIRDVTIRDGQQSLFATRMNQAQVDRVLPYYREAGFYAMEVWGGAVPDSVMRYLRECPWERLEKINKVIGGKSLLTALSRGRNLFGYSPYPESVIEGFNRLSVQSGINIMRIFDALNDIENMRSTIKYVKENGGIADCAICFTVDSKYSLKQKIRSRLGGRKVPEQIFTMQYFVDKAIALEKMGADILSVKDMAGLITPSQSAELISALKKNLKIPVNIHTHCTPGYGLAAVLMAIVNGVDIVDTAILNFAGGPAAPAFEHIQIFADKLGLNTGVNLDAVVKINTELKKIREELKDFETATEMPIDFDITKDKLPAEIDSLFDNAIKYAKENNEQELLNVCHAIEKYFRFPEPDEEVKKAEIPGGMYTNMLAQLKQLKLEHLLPKVLQKVPEVRMNAGCPPLVTPTSQIVGVQAVNVIIDMNSGKKPYTNNSTQFVNLVKGSYGKTPVPIDPDFRFAICGVREETPYDTSNYVKQENPEFKELGGRKLAKNEKEELLLELFPGVAKDYLFAKIEREYHEEQDRIEYERIKAYEEKRNAYLKLPKEEKEKILNQGLYNYQWVTEPQW